MAQWESPLLPCSSLRCKLVKEIVVEEECGSFRCIHEKVIVLVYNKWVFKRHWCVQGWSKGTGIEYIYNVQSTVAQSLVTI